MIQENTRFLIVGLGLIGGSYAMGLKKNGYHVDAIEINQLSIDYAIKHNIIDRGSTFDIDYIKEADIIISGLQKLLSEIYPCPDFKALGIDEGICDTWAVSVYEKQQRLLVNSPCVLNSNDLAAIYKSCI